MKINASNQDTVADIKEKLKSSMETENEIIIYSLKRRNNLDERLDDDLRAIKLEDEKLVAYEYTPPADKKKTTVIPVNLTRESKSMFGSSGVDDICEPILFFHHVDDSCTELRKKIFKFFFPLITLPQQYQEVYDKAENKEKTIDQIYETFYQKSDHGAKK
jgi:hypothetical protein